MVRPVDYSALTERKCSACRETKSVEEFGRYADAKAPLGWRLYSRCKACGRAQSKAYGAANKLKRNARLKDWRRDNPVKAAAVDRRKHLARYGLSEKQIEGMKAAQRGRCAVCNRKKSLMVDHCHATGRVRGLLCSACNTQIGWIENNPGIGERAAAYLGAPCHADVLLELANRLVCEEARP